MKNNRCGLAITTAIAMATATSGACGGDDATQSPCAGDTCSDASTDASSDVTTDQNSPTDSGREAAPSPCPGVPPGALDTTFGTAGMVVAALGQSSGSISAIALQADGKIIAVGTLINGTGVFGVARFDANGTIDATFGGLDGGTPGVVIVPFTGYASAFAVALQPDGKILVAGRASSNAVSNTYDMAVVRLTSDGSLDGTFGSGGKATFDLGTPGDEALGVAVKSTGEIVLAGDAYNNGAAVLQLTSAGVLDPSFVGPDGGANGEIVNALAQDARAVLIDGDKIVVTGAMSNATDLQFYVARLKADGTADVSFNLTGSNIADFGTSDDTPSAIAKTSAGDYEVAGSLRLYVEATGATTYGYGLARFTSSGAADPAFGTSGMVTSDLASDETYRYSLALDPDDRATVLGENRAARDGGGTNETIVLNRHASGGAVDSTFGAGGQVLTPIGPFYSSGASIARQADGKLVGGGYAGVDTEAGTIVSMALARYCP